jgi:hypothetical protein
MRVNLYMENPAKTSGGQSKPPQSHSVRWASPLQTQEPESDKTATYHALWAELHTKQDATAEWFADWLIRVPKTCNTCGKSLGKLLAELGTPDYADWFPFSVRLHNAVNCKLGKPEIALDEALRIWQAPQFPVES